MRESFPLGRIGGVRIGANWSLLAVIGLIALELDTIVFPNAVPHLSPVAYLVAAVVTSLVFIGTIAAHEVGHALVARHQGLRVDSIVLWALGGLTNIQDESPSPGRELLMVGIGPAISLAIGGAFVALAYGLSGLGAPLLLVEAVAWLGGLNILLGIFNLVPASPLDGGRMLHSAIWKVVGDRNRATMLSSRIGQVLGYAIAGFGLVLLFFYGSMEGLWIAITGWFIGAGATAELQSTVVTGNLGETTMAQVMTPLSEPIPDWQSVEAVLRDGRVDAAHPVALLENWGGDPSGLVTLPQLLSVPYVSREQVRARDVAWPITDVVVTSPEEKVVDVMARWPRGVAWAVALVDSKPVGALSSAELALLLKGIHHPRPGQEQQVGSGGWAGTRQGREPWAEPADRSRGFGSV
jgi:Zn-dependent protease